MPQPRDVSGREVATAIDALLDEFERAIGHRAAAALLAPVVDLYDAGRRLPLRSQRAIAPLLDQLEQVVDRLVDGAQDSGAVDVDGGSVILTPAERRVLERLPTHLSMAEIGEELCLSRNTVKTHAIAAYRKLGVTSRSAAVQRAWETGVLPSPNAVLGRMRYNPVWATTRPSPTARWSAS